MTQLGEFRHIHSDDIHNDDKITTKSLEITNNPNSNPNPALGLITLEAGNIRASGDIFSLSIHSPTISSSDIITSNLAATRIRTSGDIMVFGALSSSSITTNDIHTWNINNEVKITTKDLEASSIYTKTLNVQGTAVTSDDRLKYNEKDIIDALSTINKIDVKTYKMQSKLMTEEEEKYIEENTEDNNRTLTGVIAQQIYNVDELKPYVYKPDNIQTDPYRVDYQSLYALSIKAIQELSKKVQQLQDKFDAPPQTP